MVASPPFSLSTTTPGDSDIVSQFPLNERTLRDIIQSWILANHDANGNHPFMIMPWQVSTPGTPGASLNTVYADSKGRLKYVLPDGTVNFVGLPPGSVVWTASANTPIGFLIPDGSAVSRSTYADLFGETGLTFGAGDGSTTFNLPDIKGRAIAGEDASSTRLSSTFFGATPTRGAVGGLESQTLVNINLPAYTPTGTVGITPGAIVNSGGGIANATFNFGVGGGSIGTLLAANATATGLTTTFTGVAQGGTSTPFRVVQPTIILRALIKT